MVQKYIKIHSDDLVAVALCPLEKGTVCNVDGQEITLIEDIAQRHKFTLKDIKKINLLLNMDILLVSQRKISNKEAGFIHTT